MLLKRDSLETTFPSSFSPDSPPDSLLTQLVDLCFLVMQEQQRDAGDPVKGFISLKKQPLKGHHTCPQTTSESFVENSSLDQHSNPPMHHPQSFSVMKKRRKVCISC